MHITMTLYHIHNTSTESYVTCFDTLTKTVWLAAYHIDELAFVSFISWFHTLWHLTHHIHWQHVIISHFRYFLHQVDGINRCNCIPLPIKKTNLTTKNSITVIHSFLLLYAEDSLWYSYFFKGNELTNLLHWHSCFTLLCFLLKI